MNRLTLLQTLIHQRKLKNYLEIGVCNGHVFFRIRSNFKIAVDPAPIFDTLRIAGKLLLNPHNFYNRYFKKTSDDFFAQDAVRVFAGKKIELALIDGMHEYEFALRDVENTLLHSKEEVVLVLHDCNPQTENAASSFCQWQDRNMAETWNGDIWKTILHLRCLRGDLTCFVLDVDHGLGVVVRKRNEDLLPYTKAEIDHFTYQDFDANRKKWLDLRPVSYFYEFFGLRS